MNGRNKPLKQFFSDFYLVIVLVFQVLFLAFLLLGHLLK